MRSSYSTKETAIKKPLIVSFHTPEYLGLAERMYHSIVQFGFETDIIPIKKIGGSWIKTVYWRANFVRQMLEKHKRDVVWLDCDAVMMQYPELFDNFPADFGVHYASFRWATHELLGGTMYFSYNERTLALVDAWIKKNDEMPNETKSQRVLQAVVDERRAQGKEVLDVLELPATYTQIFDLMADKGKPVISHYQASRQFRNA